jgi:hypothetical protein
MSEILVRDQEKLIHVVFLSCYKSVVAAAEENNRLQKVKLFAEVRNNLFIHPIVVV